MLHLRPISTINEYMSVGALLPFAKRDSVGVSNTRRVIFLRLDVLFRDSRHRTQGTFHNSRLVCPSWPRTTTTGDGSDADSHDPARD
jgi:hypothetical protein